MSVSSVHLEGGIIFEVNSIFTLSLRFSNNTSSLHSFTSFNPIYYQIIFYENEKGIYPRGTYSLQQFMNFNAKLLLCLFLIRRFSLLILHSQIFTITHTMKRNLPNGLAAKRWKLPWGYSYY